MRLLRRLLLWGLLPLLLLAAGFTLWLLGSQGGARTLARVGLDALPGSSVERIEGRLWGRLELRGLVLQLDPQSRIGVDRLLLEWSPSELTDRLLHIRALEIAGLRILLGEGGSSPSDAPAEPILLPLALQLDRLQVDGVEFAQGETRIALTQIRTALGLVGERLAITGLQVDAPEGEVQVDGELVINEPYALSVRAAWAADLPEVGAARGEVELKGDLHGIDLAHRLTSPFAITTGGHLALEGAEPRLELGGEWEGVRWPVAGDEPLVRSAVGSYRLDGPLSALQIQLDTDLEGPDFPPAAARLAATLHSDGLQIGELVLGVLGGELAATGELGWADGFGWQVELMGHGLDPSGYLAEWPGRLDLTAAVSGRVVEAGVELDAQLRSVSGELRGYPVALQGDVHYAPTGLRLGALRLDSGSNRIAVDGEALPGLDLAIDLDTPDLSALWPGLAGQAKGRVRVEGSPEAPRITGELEGGAIGYQGYRIDKTQVRLRWPSQIGEGGNRIVAEGLDLAGQRWEGLQLDLSGTPERHRLALQLGGGVAGLELAAAGGVHEGGWAGTLDRLLLDSAEWGRWQSEQAVTLSVAAERARLGELCLLHAADRLCAEGSWDVRRGVDAKVQLQGLDLALVQRLLPPDVRIEGLVDGELSAKGQGDGLVAEARITPRAGNVFLPKIENLPDQIAYADAQLQARYEGGRLRGRFGIALPQRGHADAEVTLDPQGDGAFGLGGRVKVEFPSLEMLGGFVPQARIRSGSLTLDAGLGGTLERPQVNGELRLADGRVELPDAGITVDSLALVLRNSGEERLLLEGGAHSGDGTLRIGGELLLDAGQGWPFKVRVDGDRFQLVRLPEAEAVASPALRIEGSSNGVELGGKVVIPFARIEVKEVPPGTVAVSEDTVIVGAQAPAEQARQGSPVGGSVEVVLGDKVSFAGLGLHTRLEGGMKVILKPDGTEARGMVELREGSYKAYGQDLQIERGRFLFAGPPANPTLELRAMRLSNDKEVKAYLRIDGTPKRLVSQVYSEPPTSEMEALSYLLTGHGTQQGSEVNLMEAAIGLGLDHSQPAFDVLRESTGLDELGVQGGSSLDEAALVGGKYLNPDLYIGYSQSLFTGEGVMTLKYRLTDRLSIETKSGTNQAVDLIYSFER